MIKPAFIVEGELEQRFLQKICPNIPVKRLECNGDKVAISAIAKRIGTLGRVLQRKHRPLIVIFDRERREETCDKLDKDLRKHLKGEDITVDVLLGIPDREIENWILADFEMFNQSMGKQQEELVFEQFEGTSGKAKLKALLPAGKKYVEVTDGVDWLKLCRANKIKERSASFAKLATALKPLRCWWLDEKKLL